jgi:hypothetical protein
VVLADEDEGVLPRCISRVHVHIEATDVAVDALCLVRRPCIRRRRMHCKQLSTDLRPRHTDDPSADSGGDAVVTDAGIRSDAGCCLLPLRSCLQFAHIAARIVGGSFAVAVDAACRPPRFRDAPVPVLRQIRCRCSPRPRDYRR